MSDLQINNAPGNAPLQGWPTLTVEEICRRCDISPDAAERAIKNLLDRGLIVLVTTP